MFQQYSCCAIMETLCHARIWPCKPLLSATSPRPLIKHKPVLPFSCNHAEVLLSHCHIARFREGNDLSQSLPWQAGSEAELLEREGDVILEDDDVIDDVRRQRQLPPSAIDTIEERRRRDIMDHDGAMLRLGTG